MTDHDFILYKDGRYKEALNFYDDRANKNRFWYRVCSVYVLIVSVAIAPILLLIVKPIALGVLILDGKTIAAILSPTVAIVTGIVAHYRCHDNWLRYRAAWDALKHEVHWHDAQVGPYVNASDKHAQFVERVESIILNEGSDWLACHAEEIYSKGSRKGKGR